MFPQGNTLLFFYLKEREIIMKNEKRECLYSFMGRITALAGLFLAAAQIASYLIPDVPIKIRILYIVIGNIYALLGSMVFKK